MTTLNQLSNSQVKQIWETIFPNSLISITSFSDETLYVNCYLAGSRDEWANGISNNDMLSYVFKINGNVYKEDCVRLLLQVRPEDKYLAFSSEGIRKKTIKNLDEKKLLARFKEIHAFITKFKNEMPNQYKNLFDIDVKLGL